MIVIIELKKYVTGKYIYCINVGKFSYQKEFNIIILLIINRNPKINLYYTILLFCLAISL